MISALAPMVSRANHLAGAAPIIDIVGTQADRVLHAHSGRAVGLRRHPCGDPLLMHSRRTRLCRVGIVLRVETNRVELVREPLRGGAVARMRGCARAKRPACRACPGKSGCSRRRPGASAWYSSSTLWPTRKALSCSRKRFAALRLDGWLQVVRQRSHYDRRHRTRPPRSQEPSLV
jgi:hypothetical protein